MNNETTTAVTAESVTTAETSAAETSAAAPERSSWIKVISTSLLALRPLN